MIDNALDDVDQQILKQRIAIRDRIIRPRVGDYVRFPSGELERFSHDWDDGLQTSPSGSFFLCPNGQASFSGGLNPIMRADKLNLSGLALPGSFWFFHHDWPGAGRGVHFKILCRVYTTTAPYEGFLGLAAVT